MHHVHFESTDSTNTQARALAERRPGETLLVSADEQTAGRGRHGRQWNSPRGGAWMSLVWPLHKPPRHYASASLGAAVAVRRAIAQIAQVTALRGRHARESGDVQIKWPNDLLVNDAKVAGILCEQWLPATSSQGSLVVGVGVNVDFDLELLGRGLRHKPTTLSLALGGPINVGDVIHAVSEHLVDVLEHFDEEGLSGPLLSEVRQHLAYVGELRRWQTPRGVIEGRVVGVDDAGRLLLHAHGEQQAFDVGEFVGETFDGS